MVLAVPNGALAHLRTRLWAVCALVTVAVCTPVVFVVVGAAMATPPWALATAVAFAPTMAGGGALAGWLASRLGPDRRLVAAACPPAWLLAALVSTNALYASYFGWPRLAALAGSLVVGTAALGWGLGGLAVGASRLLARRGRQ